MVVSLPMEMGEEKAAEDRFRLSAIVESMLEYVMLKVELLDMCGGMDGSAHSARVWPTRRAVIRYAASCCDKHLRMTTTGRGRESKV